MDHDSEERVGLGQALCSESDLTRSVLGRQPHSRCGSQRQPADVGRSHPDGVHEGGYVVGEQFGGVVALGLVAEAGAPQVDGVAGEVLGVLRHLEGV